MARYNYRHDSDDEYDRGWRSVDDPFSDRYGSYDYEHGRDDRERADRWERHCEEERREEEEARERAEVRARRELAEMQDEDVYWSNQYLDEQQQDYMDEMRHAYEEAMLDEWLEFCDGVDIDRGENEGMLLAAGTPDPAGDREKEQ